jgi:hypothetical protein
MSTKDNQRISDRFPPIDTPSPLSRDEEIKRLQTTVAYLVRRIHILTERQQSLENQQIESIMARRDERRGDTNGHDTGNRGNGGGNVHRGGIGSS